MSRQLLSPAGLAARRPRAAACAAPVFVAFAPGNGGGYGCGGQAARPPLILPPDITSAKPFLCTAERASPNAAVSLTARATGPSCPTVAHSVAAVLAAAVVDEQVLGTMALAFFVNAMGDWLLRDCPRTALKTVGGGCSWLCNDYATVTELGGHNGRVSKGRWPICATVRLKEPARRMDGVATTTTASSSATRKGHFLTLPMRWRPRLPPLRIVTDAEAAWRGTGAG